MRAAVWVDSIFCGLNVRGIRWCFIRIIVALSRLHTKHFPLCCASRFRSRHAFYMRCILIWCFSFYLFDIILKVNLEMIRSIFIFSFFVLWLSLFPYFMYVQIKIHLWYTGVAEIFLLFFFFFEFLISNEEKKKKMELNERKEIFNLNTQSNYIVNDDTQIECVLNEFECLQSLWLPFVSHLVSTIK